MGFIRASRIPFLVALVAAAAMAVAPLASSMQESAEAPAHAEEVGFDEAALGELFAVHQRLGEIEEQALADPELVAARDALDAAFEQAMREADPQIQERIDRLEQIAAEIREQAAAEADPESLDALLAEGQALEQDIHATQRRIIEGEPIAAQLAAFQQQLLDRMTAIDPETPELIARAEALGV